MPQLSQILNRGVPGVDIDALLEDKQTPVNRQRAVRNRARAQARRRPMNPRALRGKMQQERAPVDVVSSLLSKAIVGTERPGPGIIPYGALPESIRQKADSVYKSPIVGFDPRQLDQDELQMLRLMVGKRQVSTPSPAEEARVKRMMMAQARRGI